MEIIYDEPLSNRSLRFLPESLNVSKSQFSEALLIRTLLGQIDIEINDGYSISRIIQRTNYSTTTLLDNTTITLQTIKDFLHPLTIKKLDEYLQSTGNENFGFYESINTELAFYFDCMAKRNGLSAFLHCYRILENISYSFPLIHAASSKNFTGTFKSLQDYFVKDAGELSFLKLFLKKLFDDELFLNTPVDLNVTAPTTDIRSKIYKAYKQIIVNKATFDDSLFIVSIKPVDIIDIVATLRHRYFHFAIGGPKNLKSDDLVNPDLFFFQLNPLIINWISMIYLEILKNMVPKYCK